MYVTHTVALIIFKHDRGNLVPQSTEAINAHLPGPDTDGQPELRVEIAD